MPCHPRTAPITPADEQIHKLFDERFYRLRYPDVEQSVRNCGYRSGLDHFLLEGMKQRRDPNLWFSEGFYLRAYPGRVQDGAPPGRAGVQRFAGPVRCGRLRYSIWARPRPVTLEEACSFAGSSRQFTCWALV